MRCLVLGEGEVSWTRPGTGPAVFHASAMQDYPQGNSGGMEKRRHYNTKPDIPVPVVGIVPVAIGTADVPLIIVERAAPQHPKVLLGLFLQ